MTRIGVSRRKALEAGACALAGAAGLLVTARARAEVGSSTATEEIIRKWYKAWVEMIARRGTTPFLRVTFSSPAARRRRKLGQLGECRADPVVQVELQL